MIQIETHSKKKIIIVDAENLQLKYNEVRATEIKTNKWILLWTDNLDGISWIWFNTEPKTVWVFIQFEYEIEMMKKIKLGCCLFL